MAHSEEAVFFYCLDSILNSERREDGCWDEAENTGVTVRIILPS